MKKRAEYILAVALVITIAGCSESTIDTSTDAKLESTTQQVRSSLPKERHEAFDEAMSIVLSGTHIAGSVGDLGQMKYSLHGKSAEQVFAVAERTRAEQIKAESLVKIRELEAEIRELKQIKAEAEQREKEKALVKIHELEVEMQELQQKRDKTEIARKALEKFQVVRSHLIKDSGWKRPVIELSVKNGMELAISKAYFKGTLASPGQRVPWHQDTFNHQVPESLEPGESAEWKIRPGFIWSDISAPADAVLTVTVVSLDDATGESIHSVEEYGPAESKRLAELKEQLDVH